MGNEGSVPVTYGTRLVTDAKVEWKKVEKPNGFAPRDGHCSTSVGSKLYVFGGVAWNATIGEVSELNEILLFDLETQEWSKPSVGGDVPSARSSASICAVGNKLFMFGGLSRNSGWLNDLYSLDLETMQWHAVDAKGTYPSPRDKLTSVAMGTKVLLFGGFGPIEDLASGAGEAQFGWFNDLFAFDTENETWKKLIPSLSGCPTPRAAHSMCVIGSDIVIFGGKDSAARRHDLYILNTETMEWQSSNSTGRQPEPRSFHACAAVGNRMVVFGGRGADNQHFNDVHLFDTDRQEWLQPAASGTVPTPRGVHTVNVVDDHLVVYGGSSSFDAETMQCQQYHGDTYLIPTEQLLSGKSLGPDPNDKPQDAAPIATTSLDAAAATIDKEDEEDSSDDEPSLGQEH